VDFSMRDVEKRADRAYREQFGRAPAVVTSAPGRVNLIGEHTDYNGGFVLPCAIERRVAVAMGLGNEGFFSADFGERRPATARREPHLSDSPNRSWADYPMGVAWAIDHAGFFVPDVQAAFAGDVPRGAGLSSSAAIEAATALALQALTGLHISRQELALLCRRAENSYVGVNSGIMDQYASLLCRAGACLFIDCRSLEARQVPIDLDRQGLSLLVCETRAERQLAETGYNERRAACESAARALGLESLRDAGLDDLARLAGNEFHRVRHVITENQRVLAAVDALEQLDFVTLGGLMYESHASLREDYAVSTPALDAFVECARDKGALGARLTGAGFGGSAIALVPSSEGEAMRCRVREQFEMQGFVEPVFHSFRPAAGAEVLA
jgi:galactokinase